MNFKIIALSETAINSHHTCYNIPGYTIALSETAINSHHTCYNIPGYTIALSETAINSHHTCYNIPGYTIEQDFRPKRKGGGVALYIDSNLQYKVRNDLNLGDNTNSIFVEFGRNQLKSKYNTIIVDGRQCRNILIT